MFAVVGRIQINGDSDTPEVPEPEAGVSDDLMFWEKLRVYLAAFPPPPADKEFFSGLEELGLLENKSPYVEPDPELAPLLKTGEKAAMEQMEMLIKTGGGEPVNGWRSGMHMFDYNLDYLGIGTIDSPDWKIADRKSAYATRAIAARAGLKGNHGYEANYAMTYEDADGDHLSGAYKYEMRFEDTPPVDAVWSLTMYDTPDFYLVGNPIDRYSIGDRTPGLKTNADGSLAIYMQKDSPGPGKEANWLPTPDGDFRPIMPMYQPRQTVLDGSYVLPPIRRVG